MNLKNNKKFIYFKRNMYTLSKLLKKSTIFGIKSFSKNVTIGLGIGTAIVFSNTDQEFFVLYLKLDEARKRLARDVVMEFSKSNSNSKSNR